MRARTRRGDSSPRSASDFDFILEVAVFDRDILGVGDLGEEEEFLQAAEGGLVGIGADLGLASANLAFVKPLLLQFGDEPA